MKPLLAALALSLAGCAAEAKERLVLAAPAAHIEKNKPIFLDVWLRNDKKKPINVPPLRFVSAEWSLTDPTGRRLPRAGASRVFSDHGTPAINAPAASLVHERVKLIIHAERGDTVKVKVRLGKNPALESNTVTLYCR